MPWSRQAALLWECARCTAISELPLILIDLYTDSSGAKGIALRRGLGKLRHVDVHLLWLQFQVNAGVFKINKVDGKSNPADLMTKYLVQETMRGHMKRLRYERADGRAEACPRVQG